MRKKIVGGIVLFIIGAALFAPYAKSWSQEEANSVYHSELATIVRVVDGDTVIVTLNTADDRHRADRRVRLIGIDAPERGMPYWRIARDQLEELIPIGSIVRMEREAIDSNAYFRSGRRYLRDLYVTNPEKGKDDIFVNYEMVEEGFAYASPYEENTDHEEELQIAEDDARDNNRGIWKGSSKN